MARKMASRLCVICIILSSSASLVGSQCSSLSVKYPSIVLSGIPFTFTADLPPFLDDNATIPYNVEVALYINDTILYTKNDIITRSINGTSKLSLSLGRVPDNASGYSIGLGYHEFTFKVFNDNGGLLCQDDQVKLAIPAWLTLFPPILTALIAIFLRQILLALLVGIWLGVCLVQEYNVFTAMLKTLDTYIVSAMADFDHSEIIIGTFFLGGLIGLIQKSGGGLGLANLFSRFAKTSRRGCLICFGVALLIFFDDYTSVLITGTSLRTIMYSSGVSKDKFAFIVQSMAPTMASFIPVSSWIGAQIGYASSGFKYCDSNNDSEFTIIIKTLPYRFLPFLTFYCVILVCVLNRDFACMLVSEKKNYVEHRALSSQGERTPPPGEMKGTSDTSQSDIEDLFEGPLAPKKGTPFRWFNAVIPFLIVIVFTFVGMILDGWSTINSNNDDLRNDHINMTVMNIFGNADAIAAVIWSTCLATFVIILLVLIQRILKFTECMNAWIEGVKDVIEPLFILILAWGLGNVIAEIQTSSFIAEILRSGNISYHYIPVITTIIGYFMAYCTGSAFGTMGILFPLVIPTTCQLTDDEDIQVQAAAAILSSCIFGNLMSPIADLTVLTRVSTQCDLNSHIKTCSPYILLVGFITIVFGALPVGAGWYPWYVAWIVMATILTAFFICFSTGHASASRSLFKIGCPCIYNVLNHAAEEISLKYYVVKTKLSSKIHSRLHSRLHSRRHQLNADDTVQTEETGDLDLLLNEEAETAPVSRTNDVS